jgi:hypothetical protein
MASVACRAKLSNNRATGNGWWSEARLPFLVSGNRGIATYQAVAAFLEPLAYAPLKFRRRRARSGMNASLLASPLCDGARFPTLAAVFSSCSGVALCLIARCRSRRCSLGCRRLRRSCRNGKALFRHLLLQTGGANIDNPPPSSSESASTRFSFVRRRAISDARSCVFKLLAHRAV